MAKGAAWSRGGFAGLDWAGRVPSWGLSCPPPEPHFHPLGVQAPEEAADMAVAEIKENI